MATKVVQVYVGDFVSKYSLINDFWASLPVRCYWGVPRIEQNAMPAAAESQQHRLLEGNPGDTASACFVRCSHRLDLGVEVQVRTQLTLSLLVVVPSALCFEDQVHLTRCLVEQHSLLILGNDHIRRPACFKLKVARHL